MTKEQALERVEIAHKVYEILKPVPVTERGYIMNQVEQFNQPDWKEHNEKEHSKYLDKCSQANTSRPY